MKKVLFASLLAAAAGCQNPKYCADHVDFNCDEPINGQGDPDGGGSNVTNCVTDPTVCDSMTPVCDPDTKSCVQCLASTDCAGATTPVCDTDAHTCGGCVVHADCASGTCLPDGSCADDSQVAWVSPQGTTNASCDKVTPCSTIGAGLTPAAKSIVHVVAGTYSEAIAVNDKVKTIVGERDPAGVIQTKWSSPAGSVPLSVGGTTTKLTVKDVAFTGNTMDAVYMFTNGAEELHLVGCSITGAALVGLDVTGGAVTVDRTKIANNTLGGIAASKSNLKMTNSFVTGNSNTASTGGVSLSLTDATIDFSTIADNLGSGTQSRGVYNPDTTHTCTITNSNLSGNTNHQADNCSVSTSNTYPDPIAGNMNMVPKLSATYHLDTGSPLIDAASTAATLKIDIDGDKRPMGNARDIGADEAH